MEVIGVHVLQKLRKIKGFENAVIAGGFVRDSNFGVPYKDCDIFIPVKDRNEYGELVFNNLYSAIKETGLVFVDDRYIINNEIFQKGYGDDALTGISDWKFQDVLDVQIIGKRLPEENFSQHLVETFQWGIDRIYYDGLRVVKHEDFITDEGCNRLSLIKCSDINELPKVMEKYFRLKEKYPDFEFHSKLKIGEPDKPKENTGDINRRYKKVIGDWIGSNPTTSTG